MPARRKPKKRIPKRWENNPFWRNRKKPKLKAPTRPTPPPQRDPPTPPTPRYKIKPRIKPRIKPKKRDRYQAAGLLRKGGTVKRYKKGGAAKKHHRC